MDSKQRKRISKFLSLVLRHQPESIGIVLDDAGWTDVDMLLAAMAAHGQPLSRKSLEEVVTTNDKQRFALSDDGRRIRANQGHSVDVDLGYEPANPPEFLLHGTPAHSVAAIRRKGLQKMGRHHVHLHQDLDTAIAVGARRGKSVILRIHAKAMAEAGYRFFVTPNGVWLTESVPAQFIRFHEQG